MELELYELRINEEHDLIVDALAIVDSPAIESDFLAFSKDQINLTFSADEEKMELIGAAMIPDMKIYRRSKGQEYNVFFSADTIRQIAQVFFKRGFQGNMNLDHTATPAKSFIFQSYIVDKAKGMTSPKGLNLPEGSWVVGVKVTDKDVWNEIKEGKRKGFSVEGVFEYFQSHQKKTEEQELEMEIDKAMEFLDKLINNKIKNKK